MFRLFFFWKQNPFGALIYFFFLRSVRGDTGCEAAAEVLRRSGQAREEETRRGGEGAADDPEKEKLKAKAKEIQSIEAERIR